MRQSTPVFAAAFWLTVSAFAPPASAQSSAEFFQTLLNQSHESERITLNGAEIGRAQWWSVTNKRSSYAGLTLFWIDLDARQVDLAVDASGGPDLAATPDKNPLLILTGAASNPKEKVSAAPAKGGGALVACGGTITVTTPELLASTRNACHGAQQQVVVSKTLLLRGGTSENVRYELGANRLAIGSGSGRVFIAGAFDDSGLALPLRDFVQFLALAAPRANLAKATAIDLAGGCAAQLVFNGAKQRRFGGCRRAPPFANRIIITKRGSS